MDKTKPKIALAALTATVVVWAIFLREIPKDDAAYLQSLPATIAGFAEKKQAPEIRRFISKEYRDDKGRTYKDLNRMIMAHVLRGGEITIYVVNPDVRLHMGTPPRADLTFYAAMARGARQPGTLDVIPESASVYRFEMKLEKSDDGWLVRSGDWNRAQPP